MLLLLDEGYCHSHTKSYSDDQAGGLKRGLEEAEKCSGKSPNASELADNVSTDFSMVSISPGASPRSTFKHRGKNRTGQDRIFLSMEKNMVG